MALVGGKMKYTDRELKLFNLFGLLILTLGGCSLAFGLIEFAIMPEVEYYNVVKAPVVQKVADVSAGAGPAVEVEGENAEKAVNGAESAETKETGEGVAVKVNKAVRPTYVYDVNRVKDMNLGAMSKTFMGVVFILLSLLLNKVVGHVVRHGGEDEWKRHVGFKKQSRSK